MTSKVENDKNDFDKNDNNKNRLTPYGVSLIYFERLYYSNYFVTIS